MIRSYGQEATLQLAEQILSNGNNIVEIEQTFRNITDRMLRDDVYRRSSAVTRCEIHSIKFSGLNFDPTVTPQIVIPTQDVIRVAAKCNNIDAKCNNFSTA